MILTTNTLYPSRKIRRIRACTHQRPRRKQDLYAALKIWNEKILEDIKRGPYFKKPPIRPIQDIGYAIFDGAFGRVDDEEVVVGKGVVRFSSSFVRSKKSCFRGMMVSLIFLKSWEEDARVESMVEGFEEDENDKKSGKDSLFN
ncbi:hypothetical protein Tco_0345202 [Tanacetum coccineum]